MLRFRIQPLMMLLLSCLLNFSHPCFAKSDNSSLRTSQRSKWAVGLSYVGGQVRYGLSENYALEIRYLTGQSESVEGDVDAHVAGLRGYRHFRGPGRLAFFTGLEGAYIKTDTKQKYTVISQMERSSAGWAAGGFGGLEHYVHPRLAIGVDAGPYWINLKDSDRNVSSGGLEFVINTFLNFYIK